METSTQTVLLHADLHHYNIISATREPWLIIDPIGYYGDPGYEVGAFLANCPEETCAGQDLDEIAIRRINIMIEELRMPPNRVIKWGGYFVLHLVEMRFRRLEGELARRHPTRRGIRRSIIKAI